MVQNESHLEVSPFGHDAKISDLRPHNQQHEVPMFLANLLQVSNQHQKLEEGKQAIGNDDLELEGINSQ